MPVGRITSSEKNYEVVSYADAFLPPSAFSSLILPKRFKSCDTECLKDDLTVTRVSSGSGGSFLQLQFAVSVWGADTPDEAYAVVDDALLTKPASALESLRAALDSALGGVQSITIAWGEATGAFARLSPLACTRAPAQKELACRCAALSDGPRINQADQSRVALCPPP